MDFIGHVLLAMFVALVLFAAFSAGLVLFVWFISLAVAISLVVALRSWLRRWWFLYHARDKFPKPPPKVIDADYKDISND